MRREFSERRLLKVYLDKQDYDSLARSADKINQSISTFVRTLILKTIRGAQEEAVVTGRDEPLPPLPQDTNPLTSHRKPCRKCGLLFCKGHNK